MTVPDVYADAIMKARAYVSKMDMCNAYGYHWDSDGEVYSDLADSNPLFVFAVRVELEDCEGP